MTEKRLHGKAQLVPADYEFVGYYDNDVPKFDLGLGLDIYEAMMREHRAERERVETLLRPHVSHQCTHCGAYIRHAFLFHHVPTGETIAVGETCMRERMTLTSHDEIQIRNGKLAALRRAAAAKVHANALRWVEDNADLWDRMEAARGDDFIADLRRAVFRYGSLTDGQMAALPKALARIEEWTTPGAACAVDFSGDPAPEGRVEVEGEVISVKERDTAYGYEIKMTVAADAGYKVWVTRPRALEGYWDDDGIYHAGVDRGDRVRFTATLTRSDRDPRFAFGKRPTKAERI